MASVSKRTWTYKAVEKEAWVVRYSDQRGKRRLKTFDKKKDADKYRNKVEVEIEKGEHIADADTSTVKVVAEAYVRHCEERLRAGTIGRSHYNKIATAVKKYIVPFFGNRKLITEVTWQDAEDWHRWSISTYKLAGVTIRNYLFVLKKIEAYAINRGLAKRAVIAAASRELRSAPDKPIRTFNAAEIGRLLAAADERPPYCMARTHALGRCFVHLAAFCGLRYGEIAGLSLKQVDFHRRLIRVRHSLTIYDELKGPKTRAGVRDVPMAAHVAQLLADWVQRHYVENERGLLFRTNLGGPISSANFHRDRWQPILKIAGLDPNRAGGKRFHFHALRHFYASSLIAQGVPITEVASLLGHSSFDMTLQIYAHPIVGGHHRHEIVDRMANNLLLSAKEVRDLSATSARQHAVSR